MCPPPADPIRPIGLWNGDEYVERAMAAKRVERRRPRGEQDPDHERGHHHHAHDERNELLRERWFGSESPFREAGGYDDHGRAGATSDDAAARPHVDRTA